MGRDHILAILEGGRAVISWGPSNEFGQIGHGLPYRSRVRPGVVHLGGVLVKAVACGEHHSLVLTAHGGAVSFGSHDIPNDLYNKTTFFIYYIYFLYVRV